MIFKKSYSFLIIPHHGEHGKSAFFTSRLLNAAAIVLVTGSLIAAFFIVQHYRYHFKLVTTYEPTFKENARLRYEREHYGQILDSLNRTITKLDAQVIKERSIYASSMNGMAYQVENVTKALTKVKIQAGFKGTNVVDEGEPAGGPNESVTLGRFDLSRPIETGVYEEKLRPEIKADLAELDKVDKFLATKESLVAATPDLAPLFGKMTSNFGTRRWRRSGRTENHPGLDIAVPKGTPVYSPAEGVVTFAGRKGDYGNLVELDHGTGYVTRFGHLSQIDVEVGDRVMKGQIIGLVGSTGRSTGPHLHYEVRMNGTAIDPINYLGLIK